MTRRSIKIVLLFLCFSLISFSSAQTLPQNDTALYAVARMPTPVLNVPDFSLVFGGKRGDALCLDRAGLIREVEFVALPKTVFKVKKTIKNGNANIYKVTTADYPYPSQKGYFIDSRFVKILDYKPRDRVKILPPKETIINNLISSEGSVYIWGGNYREGVPQLFSFYPPRRSVSQKLKDLWILKGMDCSGLLYEATGGFTPRNTSSLVDFGEPVKIEGMDADQIVQKVAPLDLIAWKGHVIIVLDKNNIIESRLGDSKKGKDGGVIIRDLKTALGLLLEERAPADKYDDVNREKQFVVRRWHTP
jgi:hypothetical protein